MYTFNLPKTYKPYKDLSLCSNKFVNNGLIVTSKEKIIFLIGKGETPQIWLNIPRSNNEVMPVITASVPSNRNFRVLVIGNLLTIYLQKDKILEMNFQNAEANVTFIDFTLLGLNIKGNETVLEVGKSEFSNNNVTMRGSFISIDY